MPQVMLIQVQNNPQKLVKIVEQATLHFQRAESLQILVENTTSAEYIDKLLWSHPPESFLPHGGELISIGQTIDLNARHYFNLTAEALVDLALGTIYEFDDQSSPHKQEAFKRRYHAYKRAGFAIISI